MTHPQTTPLYTVASGKGGVGKTSLTINLAYQLAKQGKRVLIVDGDTGLANADVQLNVTPTHDLSDVISHRVPLEKTLTPTPHGFYLLAGRAGHQGLANLRGPQLDDLFMQLLPVTQQFDVTFIDAAAGVSPLTLTLCARATATLLVATPDPSSYVDAYALVKLQHQVHNSVNARLILNQASPTEARAVHDRLTVAMQKSLNLPPLPLLGAIPSDKYYANAVRRHQLASQAFPTCPAIESIAKIATIL